MYEKVFYRSKKGLILFTILLLALDTVFLIKLIGLLMGAETFAMVNLFAYLAGLVILSVFSLVLLKKAVSKEPDVIVSDKGITIHGVGLVPWTEVEGCLEFTRKGQRLIGLLLHNEERYLATLPPVKRNMLESHREKGDPAIKVPINSLKDKKGFLEALNELNVTLDKRSSAQ